MSDIYSKRPASQSPQSLDKRDTKRPYYEKVTDLLSDTEHQQCDNNVKHLINNIGIKSIDNLGQKAILLSLVVTLCPPHALMNPTYKDGLECKKLLVAHPRLENMLQHAFDEGSYKELRNMMLLRADEPDSAEKSTPLPKIDPKGKEATVKSWQADFVGSSEEHLYDTIRKYTDLAGKHYARYMSIVQSSGMGKSRMIDELAKNYLVVPINLREGQTGFPPPDVDVRRWLLQATTKQVAYKRIHAFLTALFTHLDAYLKDINKHLGSLNQQTVSKNDSLAAKFRLCMTAGQSFEAQGKARTEFYAEVLEIASKLLTTSTSLEPVTPPRPSSTVSPTQPVLFRTNPNSTESLTDAIKRLGSQLIPNYDHRRVGGYGTCVILAFDEAHALTKMQPGKESTSTDEEPWSIFFELRRTLRSINGYPCFSLFLSTNGKMNQFTPTPAKDISDRLRWGDLTLIPPYCELGFDQLAKPVPGDGSTTLEIVSEIAFMASLGRPLFASRFLNGDKEVQDSIIAFAQEKLICAVPNSMEPLTSDAELACMSVRLGLEFNATTLASQAREQTQVEKHLRVCLAIHEGFETAVTVAPSEPLLAEAASLLMEKCYFDVPRSLLRELEHPGLSKGDRGELIAAQLCIAARDKVVTKTAARHFKVIDYITALLSDTSNILKSSPAKVYTEHRNVSFQEQFGDSWMYFNHFVKVHDYNVINQDFLWRCLVRGAAIICATNQRAFDLVIPFCFHETSISGKNTSAFLIQVKNDITYKDTIHISLFDAMDPMARNVFSGTPLPVIRMVFALASDNPAINVVSPPLRVNPPRASTQTKFDKYTAYDIWCAKASMDTFKVIQDNDVYAKLLLNSLNILDVYTNPNKVEGAQLATRKMNPLTGAHDGHWSGFVQV